MYVDICPCHSVDPSGTMCTGSTINGTIYISMFPYFLPSPWLGGNHDSVEITVIFFTALLQVSLLLNVPRCATVRAATHCEVMVLERSDLTRILKHFPDGKKLRLGPH